MFAVLFSFSISTLGDMAFLIHLLYFDLSFCTPAFVINAQISISYFCTRITNISLCLNIQVREVSIGTHFLLYETFRIF